MSKFYVRPIEKDELARLLALYEHLHVDDVPLNIDQRLKALWDEILNNPLLHYLVGELDGELISACTLAIIPNLTRGARPYGLIENVVTHPDHRKQGFGTRILRHALQVAWDGDCYKVMLLTSSRKEPTLRFYERAGFKRGVKTGFIAYPEK